MGYTIIPICNNCGYKTKAIAIGGGRLNHLTQCGAHALNTETNEVEEINLYDYKKTEIFKEKFLYFFHRNVIIEKTNNKYIQELTAQIYKISGVEFNINSPKQLGVVLFENMKLPGGRKTKTGYSTAADLSSIRQDAKQSRKPYHPNAPCSYGWSTACCPPAA